METPDSSLLTQGKKFTFVSAQILFQKSGCFSHLVEQFMKNSCVLCMCIHITPSYVISNFMFKLLGNSHLAF